MKQLIDRLLTYPMGLLNIVKNLFIGFLKGLSMGWWVKITTEQPQCIYYFGPFQNSFEAKATCPGYIEDLKSEEAQGIEVIIKRCKPEVLTIFDE